MPAISVQNRINPPDTRAKNVDLSAAQVNDSTQTVDTNPNKTDFKSLINNSMDDIKKKRIAKENGDLTSATDEEFLEKLADQTKDKRVPKNQLGKDDFLKLFVTQLQNQDPLNPDDGTEMAAKLAQFNGLEQMMNVNKSLEKLLADQTAGRNLQMVNYVGREVSIEGGRTKLKDGVPTKGEFELSMPAAAATLEVRDSSGILVAQKDLGPLSPGTQPIRWDGKNNAGRVAGDGIYTYAVNARNIDGDSIPVSLTAKARITGVDIKSPDGALFSDFGKITLDQIRSVGRPGFDQDMISDAPKSSPTRANAAMTTDALDRMKAQGKLDLGAEKKLPPLETDAGSPRTTQSPESYSEASSGLPESASPVTLSTAKPLSAGAKTANNQGKNLVTPQ